MKIDFGVFCALFAALAAANAAAATLEAGFSPEQERYFAGQRATCTLSLDLDGAQLLGGGNLELSGFPEDSGAVKFGPFSPAAAAPDGALRWVAPVEFAAPADVAFSPRLSGSLRRVVARHGFFTQWSEEAFDAAAPERRIKVEPLPEEGRPDDFCGAVGTFVFEATLEPRVCAPGDVLTLRWTLSGAGAERASALPWNPGEGFKAYPPRVERSEGGVFSASQAVVPLSREFSTAAGFSVSWFDPAAGWVSGSAKPFALEFRDREEPVAAEDGDSVSGGVGGDGGGASAAAPADAAADSTPAGKAVKRGVSDFVTTAAGVAARFAPGRKAKVLFEIPAGERVEIVEAFSGWFRVETASGAAGWIEEEAL